MSELGHSRVAGANTRAAQSPLREPTLDAEVVGGILTGSLGLLSDAAPMLTDVMALVIALLAIKMGQRPADWKRTLGYYRFEILAATVNAAVLFLVGFYIMYESGSERAPDPGKVRDGLRAQKSQTIKHD